jgi:hypothetical protein
MLSLGAAGGVAVSDVVAFLAPGGWAVSEVARVLSVLEALSGWARCAVSEEAGEAPVVGPLSLRAGWMSGLTAVLSEAGACPDVTRGTIKRLNPSSQAARKVECRDITALRFELGVTRSF